jgi:hypothetical protein
LRTPRRFHPGKLQNNARRAEHAKRALHTGEVVSAFAVGDATEEIKRLREQLIERDDEIRDLRYRMHLRGYNPTLW